LNAAYVFWTVDALRVNAASKPMIDGQVIFWSFARMCISPQNAFCNMAADCFDFFECVPCFRDIVHNKSCFAMLDHFGDGPTLERNHWSSGGKRRNHDQAERLQAVNRE
jgi:hypothetical protein